MAIAVIEDVTNLTRFTCPQCAYSTEALGDSAEVSCPNHSKAVRCLSPEGLDKHTQRAAGIDPWVVRIRSNIGATVTAIIGTGETLIECKAVLSHGQYEKAVKASGLSPGTARKLVAIAECTAFRSHENDLPTAWTTLYELTQWTPEALEAGLGDGRITPETERALAKDGRPVKAVRQPKGLADIGTQLGEIGPPLKDPTPVEEPPKAKATAKTTKVEIEVLATLSQITIDLYNVRRSLKDYTPSTHKALGDLVTASDGIYSEAETLGRVVQGIEDRYTEAEDVAADVIDAEVIS